MSRDESVRLALEAGNRNLARLNERLRALVESAKRLAGQRDEGAFQHDLLVEFARIMGADGGSFYVLDGEELRLADSLDPDHAPRSLPLPLQSGCVLEKALRTREPVLIEDIAADPGYVEHGAFSLLLLRCERSPALFGREYGERHSAFAREPPHGPFRRASWRLRRHSLRRAVSWTGS